MGVAVDDPPPINEALSEEDFIIYYQGFEIGDHIPFEELAKKLGFACDDKMNYCSDNVNYRAGGRKGDDISFTWFQAFYPEPENADLVIDFVVDEIEQKAWLVTVNILCEEASTYRGLTISDSEQVYKEKYGSSYKDTSSGLYTMEYWGDETLWYSTKSILVKVDKTTRDVCYIFVDYSQNPTMVKFDLPSLGD
jgi:hypothetical protein